MQKHTDSSGQVYINVGLKRVTGRVTLIKAADRAGNDWAGENTIRIQAYRESGGLQPGIEIPISSVLDLIAAICLVQHTGESE